ncbi:hypothetical protein HDU96_007981 [Phlyctochytrium bullatum]|nr:hypothetical protein HDU96_007981 [Phlyctochytrium bullatum]
MQAKARGKGKSEVSLIDYWQMAVMKRSGGGYIRNWIRKTPVESYPLLLAVACGLSYGFYLMFKKLASDPELRIRPNRGIDPEGWRKKIEEAEKSFTADEGITVPPEMEAGRLRRQVEGVEKAVDALAGP